MEVPMFLTARILGLTLVSLFVAVGLVVAGTALPLTIALGVLAALGALCIRQEAPRAATLRSRFSHVGLAVGTALGFVGVVYTVIGMIAVLGGAATAVAAVAALALLGYRHRRRATVRDADPVAGCGADSGDVAQVASENARTDVRVRRPMPPDPAALSTAELCRAWRVSYLLLQGTRSLEQLEDTAELRQRYLDELANRDPEGFCRWLDDGARAAGDPSPYVNPSGRLDRDEDQAAWRPPRPGPSPGPAEGSS
ncbi:hypothetical protein BJF90_00985 [Pseudonocardia sp. CNS-004]|nr:hypothetical protein BJF90_00985 [Pseudonocardia sp. CNS-004]